MDTSSIVKQTWQQMAERLTAKFSLTGYQVVHFQQDDLVFGSCYLIWSNDEDALRLTWDGKECWFILEETLLPMQPLAQWTEIITVPLDPDKDDAAYTSAIIDEMLAGLN